MSAVMQAAAESILLRRDIDQVAHLTLNRPNQFNSLSLSMLDALLEELDRIATQQNIRAVVLGGRAKPSAQVTISRKCGLIT